MRISFASMVALGLCVTLGIAWSQERQGRPSVSKSAANEADAKRAIAVLRSAVEERAFNLARTERFIGSGFIRRGGVLEASDPSPFLSILYSPPTQPGEPTFPGGELTFILPCPMAISFSSIGVELSRDALAGSRTLTHTTWMKRYSFVLEEGKLKEMTVSFFALD